MVARTSETKPNTMNRFPNSRNVHMGRSSSSLIVLVAYTGTSGSSDAMTFLIAGPDATAAGPRTANVTDERHGPCQSEVTTAGGNGSSMLAVNSVGMTPTIVTQ